MGNQVFLYRFMGIGHGGEAQRRLEDIVISSKLYLCSPRKFNDPFDMRAKIDFGDNPARIYEMIKRASPPSEVERELSRAKSIIAEHGLSAYIKHKGMHGIFNSMLDRHGVICFSAKYEQDKQGGPRNILMWSHYGDRHHGICLQFEPARDPALLRGLFQVTYRNDYPVVQWNKPNLDEELEGSLLRKSTCWSYENEWRYVLSDRAGWFLPFDPPSLSGIVIGCQATQKSINLISGLLRRRARMGMPSIRVMKAVMSDSSYELTLRRLSIV